VLFGPAAAGALAIAGLIALRRRPLAATIASVVFAASIVVGLLGAYFHILRAVLPSAPAGARVSVPLLVWAPPILGPLTFSLAGLMGWSAAWLESPTDSGTLVFPRGWRLRLPYSKTRAYFFMVSLGCLATVISSVLDHARTDFANPWLWLATAAGVFATVVAAGLAMVDKPRSGDVWTYIAAMSLMLLVGAVGAALHLMEGLSAARWTFVAERFLRGAPPLAPLLFSDMGMIGLIALLDPRERTRG